MFKPIKLPYAFNALEPTISSANLDLHYSKHYKGYIKKLNELAKRIDKYSSLERLVKDSSANAAIGDTAVFNMAAQVWNHEFFWKSMTPNETKPSFRFQRQIEKSFKSLKDLKEQFEEAGINHFGSGWVWLVMHKEKKTLSIQTTHDADTPIVHYSYVPLLVCDVWEHAYYPTYQHNRTEYLKNFWFIANWKFASENYENNLTIHGN
ncbi:MAG: superoxide dismutase [Candidatus Thermoplasmatota archaeon]